MRYQDGEWRAGMRVRLDTNMVWADRVGEHGIDQAAFEAARPQISQAHAALEVRREAGGLGWTDLPYQTSLAREVADYGKWAAGRFENLVVLGIGGSALGAIAVQMALNHPFWNLLPRGPRNGPRLFVLDNVDPELVSGLLDVVDPQATLFNVISKSGTTAETMAQFMIFRRALVNQLGERYHEHIVATTDPQQGVLRAMARQEGYQTFPIPEGVGGRFSVLSPVGLLSAAACGVDILELLAGAAYADETTRGGDVMRNPALLAAALHWLAYAQGQRIAVMMPYSSALYGVADWFAQLWAESLGKRLDREGRVVHVGPTPVKALGTTDQHSQVQLYVEGPFDKLVTFLFVDEFGREAPIPELRTRGELPTPEARAAAELARADLGYLGGQLMSQLINAEGRATELALADAGRPSLALRVPQVNAFTLGQLFFLLEMQTAYIGELFGINTFDQPGVEAGKIATYALMGRGGYEARRAEIEAAEARRRPERVV